MLDVAIAPSILSGDFGALSADVNKMLELGAEWIHVDIMDGHFVPNLTIGAPVVAAIRKHSPSAFLDCHLMVSRPEQWVEDFAKAGASQYTFHLEATEHPIDLAHKIKSLNMKVGIAIKPKTEVELLLPLLETGLFDLALVMTVEPGFGGQSFMGDMMPKVQIIRSKFPNLNVEVDGGIGPGSTIQACAAAGANCIVAGTSVFKAADPKQAMEEMRAAVKAAAK